MSGNSLNLRERLSAFGKAQIKKAAQRRGRWKAFVEKNYLMFWLLIALLSSLTTFLVIEILVHYYEFQEDDKKRIGEAAFIISIAVPIIILLSTWPRWLLKSVGVLASKAVAALGHEERDEEGNFRTGISESFSPNVVDSIVHYERYLKNEYILDMQKHHFAWLLVAVSGTITVLAALVIAFVKTGASSTAEAIGASIPALITGALLTIWLETRKNLANTRDRTDAIYRQKIRVLFLAAGYKNKEYDNLDEAIENSTKLIEYIRLETRAISGTQSVKEDKDSSALREKIAACTTYIVPNSHVS